VTLHHLAERFSAVAARYERGRPDCPPAVVGAIAAELRIPPGGQVLDLGAGTGKIARALVACDFDVVAIEPQAALREVLAERAAGARVLDAVAEELPLADGSLDAITMGDSFHWFDRPRALAEMARVLRSHGGIAVITTGADWRQASWSKELSERVERMRPEHPWFDGEPWQDSVKAAGGWLDPWAVRVVARQATSPERIVDHIASFSWIAAMPEDERERALAGISELIAAGETPDELPVHFYIGLTRRA
jgi:ubiquinone/menaquinone biosynthesis C-methylase UbiE